MLSRGDEKINILSDDRDIACCVTDNINLKNITSNGKSITKSNFSERVVPNKSIPFNTILLHKLFYGDKSDNYSGFKVPGLSFDILSSMVVDTLQPYIDCGDFCEIQFSDYDVFCIIVDSIDFISSEDKERVKQYARLIFPYRIQLGNKSLKDYANDMVSVPLYKIHRSMGIFSSQQISIQNFNNICNTLGVSRKGNESKELLDLLSIRAKALIDGDFIASKVISKKIEEPQVTDLVHMKLDGTLLS